MSPSPFVVEIDPGNKIETRIEQDNIIPTSIQEGSIEMAIEEKIHDILRLYCNDEVMLDAFFQWATNPTSMSAGYGLEENYPYIKKNLALRYGLSPAEAEKRLKALKEACAVLLVEAEQLPDKKYGITHVQKRLNDILSHGDYGNLRMQGVLRRLQAASEETRKALLLFNLLEDIGASISPDNFTELPSQYRNYQSEFQAYHKSIFGEVSPVLRVAREIVVTGAYNELYWVPSPGAKSNACPKLVKAILPSITELEALGTRLPPVPDVTKLLEPYWERDVEVLRLVDIVSHSYHCVTEMDEPLPVDIPNFMGLYGKTVALSPMVRDDAKQYIELTKDERMWPIRQTLENALVAVERLVEPQAGLGVLWSGQGEVVWKFTTAPPLYVYMAPWLTTSTQTVAPSRVNFQEKPHVLFIIPYQPRASFLGALEKHSGFSLKETRWEKSLGLLTSLQKPSKFHLLIGQRHPLLDRILEAVSQSGPTPPPIAPRPTPPIEPPPTPPPTPPITDVIRVGNIENRQQHGILAKLGEQNVVLDLYEPHAVSILGVQGSGKSYAAGAIIEMAVNPIPLLSELRKPLSCIIFHFSKEEKRVPEWVGLAEENSSVTQIQKLKTVYGASPSHVHVSQINILVPPTKVVERKQQYKGFNVLPLLFSPSRLKADDWKRLLTFGKGSDALYMEALGEIMIDLRAKKANFGADDLTDEIKRSELNTNQKRFALQRIKTIGRWLSEERSPFIELIKPGVVNIVDLRDPLAVDERMASLVLQTVFSFVKDRPSDEICLVAIDEAHLFFEHENLTKEIVEFVALLRKDYKVYLLLISQHPRKFHPDILGLCDLIICHRLESDFELDFLEKTKPDFHSVRNKIEKLRTKEGEAFMWARVSTNDVFAQPKLISVRPKCTEDTGKTATAF